MGHRLWYACQWCYILYLSLIYLNPGSDIIRVNTLGTNIIVLNSLEATSDLLDKRSTIYSDRLAFICPSNGSYPNKILS